MDKREEFIEEIKKVVCIGDINSSRLLIDEYKKNFGTTDEMESMEAITYLYEKKYSEALECIRSGLKINISNSDLYYTMGNIYEDIEEVNKAYLCYKQALFLCKEEENKEEIRCSISNLIQDNNITVNKISFIILTYNQLDYTKLCIDSIRKNNNEDTYEIIIVDNHSTDGTAEWIKNQKDIKAVFNDDNKGFPKGCNQGIEIADKDNDIMLLNNDTVLMTNSIFNMRMGLYSNDNVGGVGATSNSVSNNQQIDESFETFDEYINYAVKNNISNENLYEERVKLVGFALMIKREVINKIGGLDERFTPGNFEDDDICIRIILEEYKLLLCRDSFIFHFGSVSFRNTPGGYNELLNKNHNKFIKKWSFDAYSSERFYKTINKYISEEDKDIVEINGGSGSNLMILRNQFRDRNYYIYEQNDGLLKLAKKLDFNIINNLGDKKYQKNFNLVILSEAKIVKENSMMELVRNMLKDDGKVIVVLDSYKESSDIYSGCDIELFSKSDVDKFISEFCKNSYKFINYNASGEKDELSLAILVFEKLSDEKIISTAVKYLNQGKLILANNYIQDMKNSNMNLNFDGIYNKVDEKIKILTEIKFLFRRFDVKNDENIMSVFEIINKYNISDECIIGLVNENMINKVTVLNFIAINYFSNKQYERVIPYLNEALRINSEDIDTIYNIAYVLNCFGEKDKALEYLESVQDKNDNIQNLLAEIKGE